jgi:hypothetical protein
VVKPVGRDPAQRLARQELSKAMYHHWSIAGAISGFLQRIFSDAGDATPGGWWTLIALAAIVAAVVVVITSRIGPVARSGRRRSPLTSVARATARDHRIAAEASAASGDYSTAVLERLRAIAASCEERGVLPPYQGRTADELAEQAAARFPVHDRELAAAARLFDQILYGDGSGTQAGYQRLRDLDDAMAASA